MKAALDAAVLLAAFRATIYRVEMPEGRFDLQIDVVDPVFDDCLRRRGIVRWGIVTACNPGAAQLPDDLNDEHQMQLRKRLERLGWVFLDACNLAVAGGWPAEPGYFVLQIDRTSLRAVALEFSQVAVVYAETGSAPSLLWV